MIPIEVIRRLRWSEATIFDVGAERGRCTEMYLNLFPKATVYAFEPAPVALTTLNKKARTEPRLKVVPAAVLDSTGEAEFYITSADVYSSVLQLAPGWTHHKIVTQVTVPTITLDGFCADRGIEKVDVLKIDVQGAEMKVLRGADKMLRAGIEAIICEMSHVQRYFEQCWATGVQAHLINYGYVYRKEKTTYVYGSDGTLLYSNGVFTQ